MIIPHENQPTEYISSSTYKLIRLELPQRRSRCDVVLGITLDFRRVFVGGGEYGYDGLGHEADTLEIEALAERFNLEELREVLSLRA